MIITDIDSITFERISAWVRDKVPESQTLEYKQRFDTQTAAKVISSMANTYGGIIVYGVVTDKETGRPTGEYANVEQMKLDDTIDAVCFDHITPQVHGCRSKYVDDEDSGTRLFVVSVPESDITPHAVDDGTTAYIRFGSQKRKLYHKAKIEELKWLMDRRRLSIELRETLLEKCRRKISLQPQAKAGEVLMELVAIPVHPRHNLINYKSLSGHVRTVVGLLQKTVPNIRWVHANEGKTFGDGVVFRCGGTIRTIDMAFETHGLLYLSILHKGERPDPDRPEKIFDPKWMALYLAIATRMAQLHFSQLRFSGSTAIEGRVSNILNLQLPNDFDRTIGTRYCALENESKYSAVFDPNEVYSQGKQFAVELANRTLFLFGYENGTNWLLKDEFDSYEVDAVLV